MRAPRVVVFTLTALVLAGCASPEAPVGTRTYPVPDSDNLTISAPSSWSSSSVDGVYYLASPDAVDGVRPTVVVVPGQLADQSLQEAAIETAQYGSEHLGDWAVVDESPDTLGGFDAYRIASEHHTRGADVAEDIIVVGLGDDDAAWITLTSAVGDTDGAAEARAVAEELSLQ